MFIFPWTLYHGVYPQGPGLRKTINCELQKIEPVINNMLLYKIYKLYKKTNYLLIVLNTLKQVKKHRHLYAVIGTINSR